jgi:tRNA pseudouridine32 synthase/23S rRNA pseudouridine746 synthase
LVAAKSESRWVTAFGFGCAYDWLIAGNLSDITVIASTDRWVVINKPPGVLSVPGRLEENHACAASWCRQRFPGASGPITVHRLDMDTSGLLLMALDAGAQRELSGQFERRTVGKSYVAVVAGHIAADRGAIDVPMRADLTNRPYQMIDLELGKPAQTEFVVNRRGVRARPDGASMDVTEVTLLPHTGRSHQLRVHCRHIGHAILGDVLYGDSGAAERLLLHARTLAFDDPGTGERVELVCEAEF